MKSLPIQFSCMGFSTTDVFIVKDGRHIAIGNLDTRTSRDPFYYMGIFDRLLTKEEIPTPEEVVQEYNRQWIACGGKVSINKNIVYAG